MYKKNIFQVITILCWHLGSQLFHLYSISHCKSFYELFKTCKYIYIFLLLNTEHKMQIFWRKKSLGWKFTTVYRFFRSPTSVMHCHPQHFYWVVLLFMWCKVIYSPFLDKVLIISIHFDLNQAIQNVFPENNKKKNILSEFIFWILLNINSGNELDALHFGQYQSQNFTILIPYT